MTGWNGDTHISQYQATVFGMALIWDHSKYNSSTPAPSLTFRYLSITCNAFIACYIKCEVIYLLVSNFGDLFIPLKNSWKLQVIIFYWINSLFTKRECSLTFSSFKKSIKSMLLLNFPIQWSSKWKKNNNLNNYLLIFKWVLFNDFHSMLLQDLYDIASIKGTS